MEPELKVLEQPEKTNAQKCMEVIEQALKEYNCRPVCQPQEMFGQQVYVWAVAENKK